MCSKGASTTQAKTHPEMKSNRIPQQGLANNNNFNEGLLLDNNDTFEQLDDPIPSEAPDPQAADSLISRAMSSSSTKVLEQACHDVHGIAEEVQETTSFVEGCLNKLDRQIKCRNDKEAFLLAEKMNPDYVNDREFRLMFLRCDRYDIKAAAHRIVRHFQVKLDLFGKEKLALDITQDDLDKDAMDTLYSGHTQLLPTPDQSRRTICLWVANGAQMDAPTLAKMRRVFYTAMIAVSSNPDTQKRGLVAVLYFFGGSNNGSSTTNADQPTPSSRSFDAIWKMPRVLASLPLHLAAMHICYDSIYWSPKQAIIKLALGTFTRIRLRTHYGSFKECVAALQSYGIKPTSLPIEADGQIDRHRYREWLEGQRRIERRTKPRRNRIFIPGRFDVLFGKGMRVQNHIGNVKLRGLIADCRKTYEKTDTGMKHTVTGAIVDTVKQSSGLFFKSDDEAWILVDDAAARAKVSAQFRTLRTVQGRKRGQHTLCIIAERTSEGLPPWPPRKS